MKNANLFYEWFVNLGGNVSLLHAEEIVKRTNTVHITLHGFSNRVNEIKEKYNHQFKTS